MATAAILALAGLGLLAALLGLAAPADAAPAAPEAPAAPTCKVWVESWGGLPIFIPKWDCPAEGMVQLRCTDQRSYRLDNHKVVEVPESTPQWWRDEVQADQEGCDLAEHPPGMTCAELLEARHTGEPGAPWWDAFRFIPDGCWGTYPAINYQISYDAGGTTDVGKWGDRITGWLTGLAFNIGSTSIELSLYAVERAFTFDITHYTEAVKDLGKTYDDRLIGPWRLELDEIVWFTLVAYAGFKALRGKVGVSAGELAVSAVVLVLATFVFQHRDMYMNSVANNLDIATADLLTASSGGRIDPDLTPQARISEAMRPIERTIHKEFVESPYLYLNWGIGGGGKCLEVANNVLSVGNWNDTGWPARYMARQEDECKDAATFNQDPTASRLIAGLLMMIVGLVAAAFLALAAFSVLLAKFILAVLFAVTPFVVIFAVLPGTGRRVVWAWVGSLVQVMIMVVGMSFLMAVLLLGVDSVVNAIPEKTPLIERWLIILLLVSTVYFSRKKLMASSQSAASALADSLTRLSPASAGYAGGGQVGFDFDRPDRVATRGMKATAAGAAAVGLAGFDYIKTRRAETRAGKRMERLERSRERPVRERRIDTYAYGGRDKGTPGHVKVSADGGGGKGGRGRGRGGKGGGRATADVKLPQAGGMTDREWRARDEVYYRRRVARSPVRHPIGFVSDKLRHDTPIVGTDAQYRRQVRKMGAEHSTRYPGTRAPSRGQQRYARRRQRNGREWI
ncbi:MAG TPA: type IV secretion system protein [Acidimicrobiales bacterium]|nr:type IV secretion system protein [Acidimicrobiales bacterium]